MSDIGGYLGLFLGWSILHMGLEMQRGVLRYARQLYHWTFVVPAKIGLLPSRQILVIGEVSHDSRDGSLYGWSKQCKYKFFVM